MKIIRTSQSWYTEEVAQNTKDPEILVEILKRGKDDDVSRNAARNPNCPPEILVEILKRGKDDDVSYYAARNPNCPPEIFVEILKRGKDDDVSRYAAKNPNCPVKEKIEWMRATGKIGIEDPSKHIIEYDNKEEKEDEDLQKLRDLISKNNNWYKLSFNQLSLADLDLVFQSQWQEINDRLVSMGYDFRGPEDVKNIFKKHVDHIDKLEDHMKVFNAVVKGQEYIKQEREDSKNIFNKAIRYFGLTNNLSEAGYILPNGRLLDLSGKKHGGPSGKRYLDHRYVNEIIGMNEFIEMGGIRHFPEQPGVDIRKKPTNNQLNIIGNEVDNSGSGYIIELRDPRKAPFFNQYETGTRGSKVILDIQRYYGTLALGQNWYKRAELQGEWWIANGSVFYADGDIGDMNHEAYVVQSVQAKYAYDNFNKGEWIDWDGFKIELAREKFQEEYGNMDFEKYKKNFPDKVEDMYLAKLKEMGITNEEYQIAEGMGDARDYGMKHLGWKRVKGDNIQTETLTREDLREIANGLWEAYDDKCEKETFNIEVNSTRQVYNEVPYYLISDGSPSTLQSYRSGY